MSAIADIVFGQYDPNVSKLPSFNVDLDPALKEIEKIYNNDYSNSPEKKKTLEETKKMLENFRDKVSKYPKHISYEGSMVICVLLSMKDPVCSNLLHLPLVDQLLIKSLVPNEFFDENGNFEITFDNNKDFNFKFNNQNKTDPYFLTMINSVLHLRPEDFNDIGSGIVPVEKNGDKIAVGDKIILNKKGIKRLIGVDTQKKEVISKEDEEMYYSKFKPSLPGKNAFEIRNDILILAANWVREAGNEKTEDEVMRVAKLFYSFVENRR